MCLGWIIAVLWTLTALIFSLPVLSERMAHPASWPAAALVEVPALFGVALMLAGRSLRPRLSERNVEVRPSVFDRDDA